MKKGALIAIALAMGVSMGISPSALAGESDQEKFERLAKDKEPLCAARARRYGTWEVKFKELEECPEAKAKPKGKGNGAVKVKKKKDCGNGTWVKQGQKCPEKQEAYVSCENGTWVKQGQKCPEKQEAYVSCENGTWVKQGQKCPEKQETYVSCENGTWVKQGQKCPTGTCDPCVQEAVDAALDKWGGNGGGDWPLWPFIVAWLLTLGTGGTLGYFGYRGYKNIMTEIRFLRAQSEMLSDQNQMLWISIDPETQNEVLQLSGRSSFPLIPHHALADELEGK